MSPLVPAEAEGFFESVLDEIAAGKRVLLAAFNGSELVGTVHADRNASDAATAPMWQSCLSCGQPERRALARC